MGSVTIRCSIFWVCVVAYQASLLGCGAQQADVINVKDDDPVMEKAIADAKATVDEFILALDNPEGLQGIAIKKGFGEGEQIEHIWIGNVSYANGLFTGTINNDPQYVSGLAFGDDVTVPKAEISDWMYVEDGKLVGGYTIRALVELTPPEELPPFPFEID